MEILNSLVAYTLFGLGAGILVSCLWIVIWVIAAIIVYSLFK